MAAKVRLEAVAGPLTSRQPMVFDGADIVVFGRAPDCHARLPADDETVSRHHFVLAIQPPRISIRDLGSLNGTSVNGRRIGARERSETPEQGAARESENVELHDGDEVRAGSTVLRVSVEQVVFCPRCGRPIDGVTEREYAGWDDPRCPDCRARDLAPQPVPPTPARPATTDDELKQREGPLAELIRALLGRPGEVPAGAPQIPGYEIGPELGHGGMGAVYLARSTADGTEVAVKVILAEQRADDRARKLFKREVDLQKRLRGHPHCVALLDADVEGFASYFVMEYCPGGSLDALVRRRGGRLRLEEATPLILDALDGLEYAHRMDIVHRDLKPQNVLLTSREGGRAKLTDFGLAKDFEHAGLTDPTRTGDYGGNLLGMPREQVLDYKRVRPISDVWGAAAVFYNMITGELVRDFSRYRDPINVILGQDPVPIRERDASVPPGLARVIDRALSDDLTERYQTVRDFREAITAVL